MMIFYKIYNANKTILSLLIILQVFLISCEKEVSITEPSSPPVNGMLVVASDPDSAQIYLNGKNTGYFTPDTLNWLDEKTYTVTLKKKLFRDYTTSVNIVKDTLKQITVIYRTLSNVNGKLAVNSDPLGAEIFINDSSTGKLTKNTIEGLFPGQYKLKIAKTGFRSDSSIVEIRSNTTTPSYFALDDTTKWVKFTKNNSGITDNYINNVAIDHNGIKWIATSTGGLVRFDDINWTVYNTNNSPLTTDNILSISVDTNNKKWICTSSGLYIFDDQNWAVYNSANSQLTHNVVNCVTFENDKAWIGTGGGGVYLFENNNWVNYNSSNSGLSSNYISTVAVDNQNKKWFGTYNTGIFLLDGLNWVHYDTIIVGGSRSVSKIIIDGNGIPWAALSIQQFTPGGSAYFNGTNWIGEIGLPSTNVLYVNVDNQNIKWFCNSEAGLSKHNTSWVHYNTGNSTIPTNRIFSIVFDNSGNKWLATFGVGLVKYKGN